MKWKSPRCSPACWDEIKKHDATLDKTLAALSDMRRDRDEWKHQHENLLIIYQNLLARQAQEPGEADAVKLTYIKRWRTIVKLPAKYADEIAEALRAHPQEGREEIARAAYEASPDLQTWGEPGGPNYTWDKVKTMPSDAEPFYKIADAILAALRPERSGERGE